MSLRYSSVMFAPTPRDQMLDPQGRPYFLWDIEITLDEFERIVKDADADARPFLVGKLMRQAKPDDVLQFLTPQDLADLFPAVERYLGRTREFWAWLLDRWERRGDVRR
jgi:hypothetical protein